MKFNSIITRFGKGMIMGALASMAIVTLKQPAIWADFLPLLNSLAMAGAYGALTGLFLALQKWASWDEDLYI